MTSIKRGLYQDHQSELPINVTLDGAAKATEVIRDIIVPWRRENVKKMAEIERKERLIQFEKAKIELEAKKIEMESHSEKIEADQEKARLENERVRNEATMYSC